MDKDIVMKREDTTVEVKREICDENKETVFKGEGPMENEDWVEREDETFLPLKCGEETGRNVSTDFENSPVDPANSHHDMVTKKEDIKIEADQQPKANGETGTDFIVSRTNEKIHFQESRVMLTLDDAATTVVDSLTSSLAGKGSTSHDSGVNLDENPLIHSLPEDFSDDTTFTQQHRGSDHTPSAVVESMSISSFISEDSKWIGTICMIKEDTDLYEACYEPKQPVPYPLGLTTSTQQDRGSKDTPSAVVESMTVSSCFKSEDSKWLGTIIKEDKDLSEACYEPKQPVPSALGLTTSTQQDRGSDDTASAVVESTGLSSFISEDSKWIGTICMIKEDKDLSELRYEHRQPVPSALGLTDLDPSATSGNIPQISERENFPKHNSTSRNHLDQSLPDGGDASHRSCNKQIKCEVHDKQFNSTSDLQDRLKAHNVEKPHCHEARVEQFSQCAEVSYHEKPHLSPNPLCEIHPNEFLTSSNLQALEIARSGSKSCKSDVCSKPMSIASVPNVQRREKVHSGVKPYKSDVCSKPMSIASVRNVQRHEKVHSGSKPYKSDVCSKPMSIASVPNLQRHEKVHSGSKPYKCDVCSKQFSRSSHLEEHERVHSGIKPYKCGVCSKQFSTSSNLKTHQVFHSGSKPYMCDVCSKQFPTRSHLRQHERVHSGVKPYKCDVCSKQFLTRSHLRQHERVHSGIKPYKCGVCSKQFSTSYNLKTHKVFHSDSKPYMCDVCSKQFSTRSHLRQHERLHSGIKPYKCDICSKQFSRSSNLKIHQVFHSSSKPYMCDVCSKQFATGSHLRQHEIVHSGIKPHKCDVCSKQFSTRSHLREHKIVHSGIKPYKCGVCSKQFSSSSHLKVHERVHSNSKPYMCGVCSKQFSQASNLKAHERRIHSGSEKYKCDVCSKQFSALSGLKAHLGVHLGSKPYICDVCSKQFSTSSILKRHEQVHSGVKPYKCDVCSKQFSTSSNLKRHGRVHLGSKSYKCDVCSIQCSTSTILKRHHERVHPGCKQYVLMKEVA